MNIEHIGITKDKTGILCYTKNVYVSSDLGNIKYSKKFIQNTFQVFNTVFKYFKKLFDS